MGGGLESHEAAVVAVLLTAAAVMAAAAEGASWCIARSGANQTAVQTALDYACGAGADCTPIQPSGLCYLPNTVQAHASYAFNSYYQRHNMAPGSCDFAGTATVTITDPSFGSCTYPSSPNTAGGGVTPPTTPVTNTPTTNLPPTTTTSPPSFGGGAGVGGGRGGLTPGFGPSTPDTSYAAAAPPAWPPLLPCAIVSFCFAVLRMLVS